jgi:hypothetical protein
LAILKELPSFLKTLGVVFKGFFSTLNKGVISSLPWLLPLIAAAGLFYYAWKTNLGGLRTTVLGFTRDLGESFNSSSKIVNMSVGDMVRALADLRSRTGFFDQLTAKLVEFRLVWKGISDAWSDNTLSEDTFVKLQTLGLLPTVELVLKLKNRFEELFTGIDKGMKQWIEPAVLVFRDLGQQFESLDISGGLHAVAQIIGLPNEQKLSDWRLLGELIGKVISVLLIGGAIFIRGFFAPLFTWYNVWVECEKVIARVIKFIVKSVENLKSSFGSFVTWFSNNVVRKFEDFSRKVSDFFNRKRTMNGGFEGLAPSIVNRPSIQAPNKPSLFPRLPILGLSTGGETKDEGVAYLHPEEVVINSQLTKRMRDFFDGRGSGLTNISHSSSSSNVDNSVVFESGSIQIIAQNTDDKEAEKFADMIMRKIERKQQIRRIANYQPA